MNYELIARWWQSKGFGIESKTDYAYLHDVIKPPANYTYYAYDDLKHQNPHATASELRHARLLFRICNHSRPQTIRIMGEATPLDLQHIHAACPHATIVTTPDAVGDMVYVCGKSRLNIQNLPPVIVMQHINGENLTAWQQLLEARTITYDMVCLGIAITSPGRYPEHYRISAP